MSALATMMREVLALHQSSEVLDHHEFECTCGFTNHRLSKCACGWVTYDEGDIERPYSHCPTLLAITRMWSDHPDFKAEWA